MKNEPKNWVNNPDKLRAFQQKKRLYINGLTYDLATYQGMLRRNIFASYDGTEPTREEIEDKASRIQQELLEIETNPNFRPWTSFERQTRILALYKEIEVAEDEANINELKRLTKEVNILIDEEEQQISDRKENDRDQYSEQY